MKLLISSYKKAQAFKKDYVRKNGQFIQLAKTSGNHRSVIVDLADGEECDARGSRYETGMTRWNAATGQSWSKFVCRDGKIVALDFDGHEKKMPHWARVIGNDTTEDMGDE